MIELKEEQIRRFWLHSHHLDARFDEKYIAEVVGSCGLQNTPPGAWETALYNRISEFSPADMERLLYSDKSLLQAWSFRGAPVIFPASDSDAFLSALIPQDGEQWIYTRGITLALDFLQMSFDDLLDKLKQVIIGLDNIVIESKTTLDQSLAEWMLPLLPAKKRDLWNHPSMYGNPDKQSVGGAVVSFLLRPCAYHGLVVFGERCKISPTFTSYKNWTGAAINANPDAAKKLVRKYLHCYGPATADSLENWLGCSKQQAKRMWDSAADEMEPVMVSGKKAYILSSDKEWMISPDPLYREVILLGGHDPFLDQRNRGILLNDKLLQRQVWRTVSNPGVVLHNGEIAGIWSGYKKGKGMEINISLWDSASGEKKKLLDLAEQYAAFRQQKLLSVELMGL